jgi:hypothetical protein
MIVDNLVAFTSHASNSKKKKNVFVKLVKVEEADANIVCLDKDKKIFANNCVQLKSKAHL